MGGGLATSVRGADVAALAAASRVPPARQGNTAALAGTEERVGHGRRRRNGPPRGNFDLITLMASKGRQRHWFVVGWHGETGGER
jgi:hypothetical protein